MNTMGETMGNSEDHQKLYNDYIIQKEDDKYICTISKTQYQPKIIINSQRTYNIVKINEILKYNYKNNKDLDYTHCEEIKDQNNICGLYIYTYIFSCSFVTKKALDIIMKHLNEPLIFECNGCEHIFDHLHDLIYHKKGCSQLWTSSAKEDKILDKLKDQSRKYLINFYFVDKRKGIYYIYQNGKVGGKPFDTITYEGIVDKFFDNGFKIAYEMSNYALFGNVRHRHHIKGLMIKNLK